jgi:hypothetical protein
MVRYVGAMKEMNVDHDMLMDIQAVMNWIAVWPELAIRYSPVNVSAKELKVEGALTFIIRNVPMEIEQDVAIRLLNKKVEVVPIGNITPPVSNVSENDIENGDIVDVDNEDNNNVDNNNNKGNRTTNPVTPSDKTRVAVVTTEKIATGTTETTAAQ